MPRWGWYLVIFLLGGLSAVVFNTSFFSRFSSTSPTKQTVISEGAATSSASVGDKDEVAKVARVIDGDTIELTDGRRVRYIGIDTPEMGDARKNLACFGKEAMEENKRLVDGKTVRLEKDISETDRYGRLLRYVYLGLPAQAGDVFVNDYLVRQGFASVATFPPDVRYQEGFLAAEREAREEKRGFWNVCLK